MEVKRRQRYLHLIGKLPLPCVSCRALSLVKMCLDRVMPKGDCVMRFSGLDRFDRVIYVPLAMGEANDQLCKLASKYNTAFHERIDVTLSSFWCLYSIIICDLILQEVGPLAY